MDAVRDAVAALNAAMLEAARQDGRWVVLEFAPPDPPDPNHLTLNKHPLPLVRIAYAGKPPHPTTGKLGG